MHCTLPCRYTTLGPRYNSAWYCRLAASGLALRRLRTRPTTYDDKGGRGYLRAILRSDKAREAILLCSNAMILASLSAGQLLDGLEAFSAATFRFLFLFFAPSI